MGVGSIAFVPKQGMEMVVCGRPFHHMVARRQKREREVARDKWQTPSYLLPPTRPQFLKLLPLPIMLPVGNQIFSPTLLGGEISKLKLQQPVTQISSLYIVYIY